MWVFLIVQLAAMCFCTILYLYGVLYLHPSVSGLVGVIGLSMSWFGLFLQLRGLRQQRRQDRKRIVEVFE